MPRPMTRRPLVLLLGLLFPLLPVEPALALRAPLLEPPFPLLPFAFIPPSLRFGMSILG